MNLFKKINLLLLFCLLSHAGFGQRKNRVPNSLYTNLQTEVFLHPGDGFTAYTLRKNEFIYNQSPMTFPLPSWAWWGITDKITAEIDLLPLLGGLFQEPYLPVPSLNFRFKIREQRKFIPAMAFETMYQHLWRTQSQMDIATIFVERNAGNSWYNRINLSWTNGKQIHFHLSPGITYTENLLIRNQDSVNVEGRFFRRTINPDLSMSFDWRAAKWVSTFVTASYGTTFVYLDNIPRKYQVAYGARFAPFHKNRIGFLRTFRIELTGLYMYFNDAKAYTTTYFPIYPYFYWQWKIGK